MVQVQSRDHRYRRSTWTKTSTTKASVRWTSGPPEIPDVFRHGRIPPGCTREKGHRGDKTKHAKPKDTRKEVEHEATGV
ncbi:hypothetical protein RUM44_006513 [Polyplax serrata]|uniref:Uncharacterized protein n=1 Tax=Polyplax serrata TaxID=468196 RepID=A0ABR1AIA7_POLSC